MKRLIVVLAIVANAPGAQLSAALAALHEAARGR